MGSFWGHMPNWALDHPNFQALSLEGQWLADRLWLRSDRWGQGYADRRWLERLTVPPDGVDIMRALAEVEAAGLIQVYPDPSGRCAAGALVYRVVGYDQDAPRDALRNRKGNTLAPPSDPGMTAELSRFLRRQPEESGEVRQNPDTSGGVWTNPDKSADVRTRPATSGQIRILPAEPEPDPEPYPEPSLESQIPKEMEDLPFPRVHYAREAQGSPPASPPTASAPHDAGSAGSTDVLSPGTRADRPPPEANVPAYVPHQEPPRGARVARSDTEHFDRFADAFGMKAPTEVYDPDPDWKPEAKPVTQGPGDPEHSRYTRTPYVEPSPEEIADHERRRAELKARFEAHLAAEAAAEARQ